jgi:alpha-L-fucosidase
MGVAHWWSQRRFGLSFEASLAAVPSWAPVGQEAAWYRAHIDADTRDLQLHPGGLAEALDHHRLRWAHVEQYDDFLPFLHFDEFDPDEWAALARDAGAGYALMTAKHHDGLCWWDARDATLTVIDDGPRRNVFGEFAAACERADLVLGATYSLLDWADARYPGRSYVSDVLHPQVLDLVERHGVQLLWGDAHWGAGGDHWRSDELLAAARRRNPDLVVNDRWWGEHADVATREFTVPDDITAGAWEYRRPLGASAGYNRAEPAERVMSAKQIVTLLTEIVAKGGHLLLQIGPDAAGRIPDEHADPLRAAGGWIRRHQALVDRGRPWDVWGDHDCRFLTVDDDLVAVDVSGQGRFGGLTFERGKVISIEGPDGNTVMFDQTDDGVRLERPPRKAQRLPAVYQIVLEPPLPAPIELFPDAGSTPIELEPLLADAMPGSIVQLADGVYTGPGHVPAGVTLRGLGPGRTTIDCSTGPVQVGDHARLAHCRLVGEPRIGRVPRIIVELAADGATALDCEVDGHISVSESDARVTSCTVDGVLATGVDRREVSRCTLAGMGADSGIEISGGSGHLIDSCEATGHLAAITLSGAIGSAVSRNRISARWWGVRLIDTEAVEVTANAIEHTMRAVDVDGGTDARVSGNAASDGDSGCLLQHGASNAEVAGNYWERCRIGLLAWNAGEFRERDNTTSDLGDPDGRTIVGP